MKCALVLLLCAVCFSPVRAQTAINLGGSPSDGSVRMLIPQLISLRRAAASPDFDLSVSNFPPEQYPARYLSSAQEFSVFSTASTPWTVQLEVQSTPDDQGYSLPVTDLSYRVNGGPWMKTTGAPQVVLSQVGPTSGWVPLKVELALDLQGGETGGNYAFNLAFTAQVLP